MGGAFMVTHRAPLIMAAARNNVPAVYSASYFARDGGLLSYGPDPVDIYRRAASYVDRILRGEKPADLPVQAPTIECEVLSPCRGRRPHHVQRDRIGTWEVSCLAAGVG